MLLLYLLCFAAIVPIANWMIEHVGICNLNEPCVIPLGFGLYAPSGVLLVGVSLTFRDLIQERCGIKAALFAVLMGSALSALLSDMALVIASVIAFAVSETLDTIVYTPLRRRGRLLAVVISGLFGAAIDSMLFLLLAFGDLAFFVGHFYGKVLVVLLTAFAWKIVSQTREM